MKVTAPVIIIVRNQLLNRRRVDLIADGDESAGKGRSSVTLTSRAPHGR